jgi:hypothetical protein
MVTEQNLRILLLKEFIDIYTRHSESANRTPQEVRDFAERMVGETVAYHIENGTIVPLYDYLINKHLNQKLSGLDKNHTKNMA